MELDELRKSLVGTSPPAGLSKPLQALWHDAKGDWQRAHEIVQSLKGSAGARVHAYLHRKEGDLDNARYWHGRAGTQIPTGTLEQEWQVLVMALLHETSNDY